MKKNFNNLWKGLLILSCCLFIANATFAQQWGTWCYKDYTSSGTYTFKVPTGCTKVYFEAVGGGGAGGFVKSDGEGAHEGDIQNYYKVSGGGGGGAYGRSATIESGLGEGETFTITVGRGGRNTASRVTHAEYMDDCTISFAHDVACLAPSAWNNHNLYKKFYHGFYIDVDWDNLSNSETYEWPFYKNRVQYDGGTSSVKRNTGGAMILEAYGGKTCMGENNTSGGAGGAAGGAGLIHARGGSGGNAAGDCGTWWGRISSGGGGAAGHPGDYSTQSPDHRTEAYCDAEEGFGRGGTGYPPFYGYGGEGTSDWAWDADSHNGRQGDPGQTYGGGGGGSKIGTTSFARGGDGANGIVRVWFYIEERAISIVPTASPATITGSGTSFISAGLSNQLVESGMYNTEYSWNNGNTSSTFTTPTLSGDATYCVTATNTCTYATNWSACKATVNKCVTVKVNPIDPGAIKVDESTWVCNPGDTVVTILNDVDPITGSGDCIWQYSTDDANWSLIPGANAWQYTASATGYYRRGYSEGSIGPLFTNSVHITHPSDIHPGTIKDASNGTSTSVCTGSNVSLNLSYTGMGPGTYNVKWQTSPDKINWTTVGTASSLALNYTGITDTTYVRYLCVYSSSCNVPSNNIYAIYVWDLPEVKSIAAPTDLCPGKTSYTVTATVTEGDATINTYNWTGVGVSGSSATGTITPSLPNCNTKYDYCLKVTDTHGCQSEQKCGTFTTENPTWSLSTSTINVIGTSDGSCNFSIPSSTILTEALNNVLTSTCGNAATLSNINPAVGSGPITGPTTVTATATDMCGVTHTDFSFTVVKPAVATVTVAPTSAVEQYLCPGEVTTIGVITDAENPTFAWTPSSLGTGQYATTIAYTGEDVTVHTDNYSVEVTDKYGCKSHGDVDIYTTPKAYISDKTYEICTPASATFTPESTDKVPAGIDGTFTYTTTYTWTITSNTGVTGATEGTNESNFTTGTLTNTTLSTQTVTYSVIPTTATNDGGYDATSCSGDAFTVTVEVKPSITTAGAITDFDDADIIITLWYGACDTLYDVTAPTYTNNTDLSVILSNDQASANNGPIMGRIAPGVHEIEWKLTDECGNEVTYTKKYIVRYPNCGDADPNYTEPYIVKDVDNFEYHTVRIGCECWTASNLRTVTGAANSSVYNSPDYPNETENEEKFGRLYSWYTAVNVPENDNSATPTVSTAAESNYNYVRGICPEGWAIPNSYNLSSMVSIAGGADAVKSSSNLYWLPGAEGTDASGFGARGAGYYDPSIDRYVNLMGETYFWSYESSSSFMAKCGVITYYCPQLMIEEKLKGMGYSIRCIRRENP